MRRYRPEPPQQAGTAARVALLLVNLGTPAAPTAAALRRYLAQFLADPRVVEIPRLLWLPLLFDLAPVIWCVLVHGRWPDRPRYFGARSR